MRYAISGSTQTTVTDNNSTAPYLMGVSVNNGRVFWLTSFWSDNASGTASEKGWVLYDCTQGATGANAVAVINSASELAGGALKGQVTNFPAPGLKFTTGVCVLPADALRATAGRLGGCGYEEA